VRVTCGFFGAYPYPYPQKPVPLARGIEGYWCGDTVAFQRAQEHSNWPRNKENMVKTMFELYLLHFCADLDVLGLIRKPQCLNMVQVSTGFCRFLCRFFAGTNRGIIL
jgi:hypothetical protein